MDTRNVTITSKNQITLPSSFVKDLKLDKSRVLKAEIREGSIILVPQSPLVNEMQKYWGKHKSKKVLSDKDLKQAIREAASNKVA